MSDAVCTLVLPEEEEVCPEKLTWIEAHGSDCRRVEAFAKECLLKSHDAAPNCNYTFESLGVEVQREVDEADGHQAHGILDMDNEGGKEAASNEGCLWPQEAVVCHPVDERK